MLFEYKVYGTKVCFADHFLLVQPSISKALTSYFVNYVNMWYGILTPSRKVLGSIHNDDVDECT